MRHFVKSAAIVALFATACVPVVPVPGPGPGPGPSDACGAGSLQYLVGLPVAASSGVSAPGGVRRIGPGDIVTLDLRPNRLNIDYNGAGRITRVHCG